MESTSEALGLGEVVGAALVAALPGLAISIWAWFKARAAASPETWDDRVVRFIEQVAQQATAIPSEDPKKEAKE